MKRVSIQVRVNARDPRTPVDLLAPRAGLSKTRVKEAMEKGAVWLTRAGRSARTRLRRATAPLRVGDRLELFFDETLLGLDPPPGRRLLERDEYSVWLKPAGLLSQGTDWGDHCSLLRQVEKTLGRGRGAFLVHRLDREATGLMLVAHSPGAAGMLSRLFQGRGLARFYRVEVLGDLRATRGARGTVELPLDGKEAATEYEVLAYDEARGASVVDVRLRTGRTHQIRRHFAALGHPVLGDPRYGVGNKNREGLRLAAYALEWRCPYSGAEERVALDPEEVLRPAAPGSAGGEGGQLGAAGTDGEAIALDPHAAICLDRDRR